MSPALLPELDFLRGNSADVCIRRDRLMIKQQQNAMWKSKKKAVIPTEDTSATDEWAEGGGGRMQGDAEMQNPLARSE